MAASPSASEVRDNAERHENDDAESTNTGTGAEQETGSTTASTEGAMETEEDALTLTPAQIKKMIAHAVIKKKPAASNKRNTLSVSAMTEMISDPSSKSTATEDIKSMRTRREEIAQAKKLQTQMIRREEKKQQNLRRKASNRTNNDLMNVFLMRKEDEATKKQRLEQESQDAPSS